MRGFAAVVVGLAVVCGGAASAQTCGSVPTPSAWATAFQCAGTFDTNLFVCPGSSVWQVAGFTVSYGDGATYTDPAGSTWCPVGSCCGHSHTYASPGTYSVVYSKISERCPVPGGKAVSVGGAPGGSQTVLASSFQPRVTLTATPATAKPGESVKLDVCVSSTTFLIASSGTLAFGDGSSTPISIPNASRASPTSCTSVPHTYASAGAFTPRIDTSAGNCSQSSVTVSATASVTVGSAVSATVSGTTTICAGRSATLSTALTGAPPWSLTWSDGAVQSGISASPARRTVSPSSTTRYTVTTVRDATGATAAGGGSALVSVADAPAAPVITAPDTLAGGQANVAATVTGHSGSSYQWSIVNGAITSGATTNAIQFTAGTSGSVTLNVVETSAAGCPSPMTTKSIAVCAAAGAPTLTAGSAAATAGQSIALSWTPAPGMTGGTYVLETSTDGFATVASSRATAELGALVPTDVASAIQTLSFRVRAVPPCGPASPPSNVFSVTVRPLPASFVATSGGPSWAVRAGDPAPAGVVTFRNAGGASGRIGFTTTGGFFTAAPDHLDLAPGQQGAVTLAAAAQAVGGVGAFAGLLVGTFGSDTLSVPVMLTVAPAGGANAATLSWRQAAVRFLAPSGANPGPKQALLHVDGLAGPFYLSTAIGPGAWLSTPSLFAPVFPGDVAVTLNVDRTRRTRVDGAPPLRTTLTVTPVGKDPRAGGALLEVVDAEPVPVVSGAGARGSAGSLRNALALAPPGGTSFIVPTVVSATSGVTGQTFTTSGWLRNPTASSVPADLFFTPRGLDGLSDARVLKATISIPAASTFLLSDILPNVFGTSGSGQLEVRSPSAFALSLRTFVESIQGGDARTRFATEIPTERFGGGVGAGGGELVLSGIREDAASRANLILAETRGAPATARVAVYTGAGAELGALEVPVPAYGQVQIDRVVSAVATGHTLADGWVGVSVTGGAGTIAALATVIDNASGSFSALRGQRTYEMPASARAPLAAVCPKTFMPTMVRLTGANDTRFLTELSMTNGQASPASLTLTYTYYDLDAGGAQKTATREMRLGPRAHVLAEDAIGQLFGLTQRTYGFVMMEGDTTKVSAHARVKAQCDPADAAKGFYAAQVDLASMESPDVAAAGAPELGFPGAEESLQKRTALVLLEVGGAPVTVRVSAHDRTNAKLGERTYTLAPFQYLQLNSVLTSGDGLAVGAGPFQDVEVRTKVLSGDGRLFSFVTVNDNVSRNPAVFPLASPGPPVPTIGF